MISNFKQIARATSTTAFVDATGLRLRHRSPPIVNFEHLSLKNQEMSSFCMS